MLECYAIKDKKTAFFQRPFFVRHIVEATRAIEGLLKDREHPLAQYPADFALYRIGAFDDTAGKWTVALNGPIFVSEVSSFVNPIPAPQPVVGSPVQLGIQAPVARGKEKVTK